MFSRLLILSSVDCLDVFSLVDLEQCGLFGCFLAC